MKPRHAVLLAVIVGKAAGASVTVQITAPSGTPVLSVQNLDAALNASSLRVIGPSGGAIPSKTDWRTPRAAIAWISRGPGAYTIQHGVETRPQPEPAMIGSGDRITFGRPGVRGRLSVGLWAYPAALDMDGDGNTDLIVGCPDHPYNGIYLFRNLATNAAPLFDRAEWLGPGGKDLVAADFNGDGAIDLVTGGGYYSDVRHNRLSKFVAVKLRRTYWVGRDDLWYPVDWDHDGRIDLLTGVSDWRDYGWDDAFNAQGVWTRGPLHGYIYFHRNTGSNARPSYAEPVHVLAGEGAIDQYGSPVPNPVDWLGTGRLDLIAANFIDSITLFRNTGSRLGAGQVLPVRMDLCMIQPRAVQWHSDGRPSLLVGEEDGRVALIENLAPHKQEPRLAPPRYLEQVDPFVKCGALARPAAADWNGDGRLDLLCGNSAGYIQFFEDTGAGFEDRGYLTAAGQTIRIMAGANGSVQGPAESKWGYTNISVADWDLDGRLDILVNDITGAVKWFHNTASGLEAARFLEVEWPGAPPKPDWVWWTPQPKQLVTQWRTTPKAVDWDRDGLPDLVMLDHRGYLCLYPRARRGGALVLLPPEPIFLQPSGRRKIELADWDSDGDLDLISDSPDGPIWYANTGTQRKPVLTPRGLILKTKFQGHNATPIAVDWNRDGKLDVIVGAEDGFLYYFDRNFIERN